MSPSARDRAQAVILGSGTSHGVPMIGCTCAVCSSDDPHDTRLRPSVYLQLPDGVRVLIDTTPDLRAQALRHAVTRVDAILFTHSHADHIFGLDEIRRYNVLQKSVVPCFGDRRTIDDVRRIFSYAFGRGAAGGGVPQLQTFVIDGVFSLGRTEIVPVPVLHGSRQILGFRLGAFAYLTDTNQIPDASWPLLDGVELLVLDALRRRPHPTHFSVAEALEVVARLAPARTYFTHVCHDLPHAATSAGLPDGVELAYDGLTLDVPGL